jgi:hypothetical protein
MAKIKIFGLAYAPLAHTACRANGLLVGDPRRQPFRLAVKEIQAQHIFGCAAT